MEKVKFAKIFDLKDYQVLVTKIYLDVEEDAENRFAILQTTFMFGELNAIDVRFKDEASRDKEFRNYCKISAMAFVEELLINAMKEQN